MDIIHRYYATMAHEILGFIWGKKLITQIHRFD